MICECRLEAFIKSLTDFSTTDAKWENKTEAICGKKYFASDQPAEAIAILTQPDVLSEVPRKYWRQYTYIVTSENYDYHGLRKRTEKTVIFAIGLANHNKEHETWKIDVGDVSFHVSEKKVVYPK